MRCRLQQLKQIQKQGYALFAKKNADYGDAFSTYGPIGVLVRIGDKLSRLSSIQKNGVTLVDDETLRDTLIDLHNYSAMAIMCMDDIEQKNVSDPHIDSLVALNTNPRTTSLMHIPTDIDVSVSPKDR